MLIDFWSCFLVIRCAIGAIGGRLLMIEEFYQTTFVLLGLQ